VRTFLEKKIIIFANLESSPSVFLNPDCSCLLPAICDILGKVFIKGNTIFTGKKYRNNIVAFYLNLSLLLFVMISSLSLFILLW